MTVQLVPVSRHQFATVHVASWQLTCCGVLYQAILSEFPVLVWHDACLD